MRPVDLTTYIEFEAMLAVKLQELWKARAEAIWADFDAAFSKNDFAQAEYIAQNIDVSDIGTEIESYAAVVLRGAIDFGAQLAGGQRTLTSSLQLDKPCKSSISQLKAYLRYGMALYMQKYLLQLIAQKNKQLVQKAGAVREFVSFKDSGDQMLQMISALHTSRLSGWGFLAEADLLGYTTYKLSAQLDNRTSAFCRAIHGKTFTIESARGVLDAVVSEENPDALKILQPWPKQNKANMERINSMTTDELVANRLNVPPFHPNCRTLMVPVSYETRISNPRPKPVENKVTSTAADFTTLGIPITKEKLAIWNDYIGQLPIDVLKLVTGTSVSDLLIQARTLLRITSKGDIKISWVSSAGPLYLQYNPGNGVMKLAGTGTFSLSEVVDKHLTDIRYYAQSVGASSLETVVAEGQAVTALTNGFIPTVEDWPFVKRKISSFIANEGKTELENLSTQQRSVLQSVLVSNSNKQALKLISDLPMEFTKVALEGIAFNSIMSLDSTGLS